MTSLIKGIIHTRTVSLSRIACEGPEVMDSSAKDISKYRRFQRFFTNFDMTIEDISKVIRSKIPIPQDGYLLSMDRTNLKFGKKPINILTLGINVGSVCVPLVWKVLPQSTKNGNSNTKHRQWVIRKVLEILPANQIHAILMDREFCGSERLKLLATNELRLMLISVRRFGKKVEAYLGNRYPDFSTTIQPMLDTLGTLKDQINWNDQLY